MRRAPAHLALFALGAAAIAAPSPASAGPYASPAMGRGVTIQIPFTLHVGGTLGAGLGRSQGEPARALLGGGFLEAHMGDIMVLGLGAHAQTLPALPERLGPRASAVEVRLGLRLPLVANRDRGAFALPVLAFRGTWGVGWLGGPPSGQGRVFGRFGAQLAFELVLRGRVTPFVAVSYTRSSIDGSRLRQAELSVGLSVLLAGDRRMEPRERGPRERLPARTEELLDRLRDIDD